MMKSEAFIQAGKTAVLQNIHGTMQFLQRFPPFNQMENAHLAYLVEQCQLRFYGPGDSIIRPDDGPVEHFYIVKQGRVVANARIWAGTLPKPRSKSPPVNASRWPRCWVSVPRAPSTAPPKTPFACN